MSVHTWGLGKNGQLGNRSHNNSDLPILLSLYTGQSSGRVRSKEVPAEKDAVVSISAGGLSTALITSHGAAYCCGSGKHGRLGSGTEDDSSHPQRIDKLYDVHLTKVSIGIWHGAALSDRGDLYVWGYNKSHGVLGVYSSGSYAPPALLSMPDGARIAGVTCGNNYTLAWDMDGRLFSWGCGRHGVLGQGDEQDRPTPTEVSLPAPVINAEAGFAHAGIVTRDGQVLMMGLGSYGALGLGRKRLDQALVPTPAKTPENCSYKELSCSKGEHHGHTLAVTAEGEVYAWGDGYKGKLGLGDQESRYVPTLIPSSSFNGETVLHVSAGGIHSAAVSVQGHVFTWGCGSDGRLGHPEAKGHRYLFRSDMPRLVEALSNQGHAVDVKASYYHTVALVAPH